MKCPQCNAKIDKGSQYCQYCGFELISSQNQSADLSQEMPCKQKISNKTAFVTSGEIFTIGKNVAVLGIATQELKVGDELIFNDYKLKIKQIDLLKMRDVRSVPNGNCVLYFAKLDERKFKVDVQIACEKYGETNQPISFTSVPTTKYVFFDLK